MNAITRSRYDAPAATIDPAHVRPRRILGFDTVIETSLDAAGIRASLEEMSTQSAFDLADLSGPRDCETPDRQCFDAKFRIRAMQGTTGDPQIFALLRQIAEAHRWNGVDKIVEPDAGPTGSDAA